MFQLYITLGYFIPAIYVYFRIRNLFITSKYKLHFTLIYLVFVAVSPLARYWRNSAEGIREFLNMAAGYLVPFLLYLFLTLLVYDLLLLLNLLIKVIPKHIRDTFRYRMCVLTSIIIVSIAVVVGGVININTIQVSEYTIEVPRKQSRLNNLRVAFVADIHIDRNTSVKFIEQYAKKVKALNPDILLYGGDIVEGRDDKEINAAITNVLKNIKAKYGVYGILGNHEFYGSDDPGRYYPEIEAKLLRDEMIKIGSGFYLAGRVDDLVDERKNAGEIVGAASDLPVILLDHRPTELRQASRTQTNVQLSGHTHNGQMFPINLFLRNMYELTWGYKKINNTHFFVTSGLRLWGPPVKTAGKAEIMLINISFK